VVANVNEGSGAGTADEGPRFDDNGQADQYTDLTQLVTERFTSLAGGLVESIRSHPLIAAAAVAASVGALFGIWMARRRPRSRTERLQEALAPQVEVVEKGARQARKAGERVRKAANYSELVPLALKLLENPIVRAYLVQALTKRVAKQLK
jgi:hypothetical protein